MAIFGYTFLPQSESGLPSPTSHGKHDRSKSGVPFGRARARWVIISLAVIIFIFFCLLLSSPSPEDDNSRIQTAAHRLGFKNDLWCSLLGKKPGADFQPVTATNQWMKGSGRAGLSYHTPFNPDDLTMTEDECDAFFPDLYRDINRSVDYFTTRQE